MAKQVKLSERELNLLGIISTQANLTIAELAKLTKLRTNVVQYSLQKFKDLDILSPKKPMIDLHGLGYTHYTLYFSLAARNQQSSFAFLDALKAAPYVTWVFELAGRFQYAVSITTLHPSQVAEFSVFLGQKLGKSIMEKSLTTQLDFEYYGRRYLLNRPTKSPVLSFQFPVKYYELDELDYQLLEALAHEKQITIRNLSRALGAPTATIDRRKRALEEKGVIQGYFYWINSELLGRQTYIFRITSRGIQASFKAKLVEFARSTKDVLYFIECLGNWDFELGVELESSSAVSRFTQLLYNKFSHEVLSVEPIPVLRYFSVKSYPRSNLL